MADSSVKTAGGGVASAKPGSPGLSDGSVPQEFLIACEAIALEVGRRYLPNCLSGAVANNGTVTVTVSAYERQFQFADISVQGDFTIDNTAQDMYNFWGSRISLVITYYWGELRLDTDAPHTIPASDVVPPTP